MRGVKDLFIYWTVVAKTWYKNYDGTAASHSDSLLCINYILLYNSSSKTRMNELLCCAKSDGL